jgi:flagellar biosynthesis chaperone FliJ
MTRWLAGDGWQQLGATQEQVDTMARQLADTEKQAEALNGQVALGGIVGKKAKERAEHVNREYEKLEQAHAQATKNAVTRRADLEQLRDAVSLGGAYDDDADPDDGLGYHVLNFWSSADV